MSSSPRSDLKPLSIGNVVSTALILYRSHLGQYFGLSIKAVLWWFIPVYGWAKALTINAQISRLAFTELINRPETVSESQTRIQGKMWSFLGAGLLVGLIVFGINMGVSLVGSILSSIVTVVAAIVLGGEEAVGVGVNLIVQLLLQIVILVAQLWAQSRLFLYETALAMEHSTDATGSIGRSWNLTTGHTLRAIAVVFVAGLLTVPLFLLAYSPLLGIIPFFVALSSAPDTVLSGDAWLAVGLWFLLAIVLALFVSIFVSPFWQALKAALYADLRVRREGLDFQLRDS